MKLTKEQFKEFILSEVKKLAVEEGWIESPVVVSESVETVPAPQVVTEEVKIEQPVAEEPKVEIAEVKRLAEEFTRMKALVDFRSPLLRKDNQ